MTHLVPPRLEGAYRIDGRRIGFAEYGDPGGFPVLWFHGTPGGRRQVPPRAREIAGPLGIRLVALERPGVGHSTPHRYRTLLGWADDVRQLADRLGWDRFACVGLSGGGPYVLACAAAHPERMTAGAVLGGVAPTTGPEAVTGGLVGFAHRLRGLLGWVDRPLRRGLWATVRGLAPLAGPLLDLYIAFQPEGDRRVFEDPAMREMFLDDILTTSRVRFAAAALDLQLFVQPWPFSLRDLQVPLRFWHGDADHIVPLPHVEHIVGLVPDAELTVRPAESHLGTLAAADEILRTVRDLSVGATPDRSGAPAR